jgi:uncharacterized protein YecT (DUF1311 family)
VIRRVALVSALLAAAGTTGPAGAGGDCASPSTQGELNRCAYEAFLAANDRQAAALENLAARLSVPQRRQLREAQKAWMRWRTAQCEFESAASAGGSVRPMLQWQCATRITRERTEDVERLANCAEGDLACPRG